MPLWGSSNKAQPLATSDRWAPLAPSAAAPGPSKSATSRFASVLMPSKPSATGRYPGSAPLVGRWPENVLLRIVENLPVHDLPAVARTSRAFSRLVRDERGWEARCNFLRLAPVQAADTAPSHVASPPPKSMATPRKSVSKPHRDSMDDDFGDFSTQNDVFEDVDFGDLGGNKQNGALGNLKPMEDSLLDFGDLPLPSRPGGSGGAKTRTSGFFALPQASPAKPNGSGMWASSASGALIPTAPGPFYQTYKAHHLALLPLCRHLRSSPSPSSTLALLFPPSPVTSLPLPLDQQADRLLSLILFLSPDLQPLHDWGFLRQALLAAADRFDSTCLVAFEVADSRKDEDGMRAAAESSWKVWEAGGGSRDQWECGRVWVEKREVFYETSKWDAMENIVKVQSGTEVGATIRQLDFTPMDAFIAHVLETFRLDAELAVRIFPRQARVVLSFCDRVAHDVIGEYIQPLLSQARVISQDLFLQATAATFVQAWKLVDVATEVLGKDQTVTPRTQIEDAIYRMFEVNMDEYLDEETEWVKTVLEGICGAWSAKLGAENGTVAPQSTTPTFLSSSNPDQVKRNVLAGFRDVLLLPVTIVPRTVTFGVNAIVTGSTQAVSGLAMLNPQKWGANAETRTRPVKQEDGEVVFEVTNVDTDADEKQATTDLDVPATTPVSSPNLALPGSATSTSRSPSHSRSPSSTRATTPMPTSAPDPKSFDRLQLLVSLDTALELIHADRDSLKRCETFAKYPGKYGHRVRESMEEIFILMLKATGDKHIAPGFRIAQNQMGTYKPAEHEETTSVAPLLQFFELVHIGDTIQSMVQVYFDKDLTPYVDKTDFLNAVMREKKRFEAVLDDAVAAGLNAGIEVLMNQVEHIILVKTGPREYYPADGTPLELGPTEGCKEAIACLEMHCDLLRGSTSKEVLEVFYQEVGIRLQGILQRHLKRQIISLEGGFQIIADLNAYHAFVASLKQQRITDDFANLKMLGHVYIVSDAKDLAQIVRDVTRYGGTFRPEDIYEFIQRRADWKKIEKTVDKAMYALSVKDDCVVM